MKVFMSQWEDEEVGVAARTCLGLDFSSFKVWMKSIVGVIILLDIYIIMRHYYFFKFIFKFYFQFNKILGDLDGINLIFDE